MSETSTTIAESDVTLEDPTPAPVAPEPATQIEDEPATEEPAEDAADPGPLPEVEATVGRDNATGKYLVSITTRHPDPTVVAVNGRAVWEG